jgi:hypothetical protein
MKTVHVYPCLDALPETYRQLFEQQDHQSSVFLSLPWFQNLFNTSLEKEHSIRLFGLEEDAGGVACALLPMCFPIGKGKWYKPRTLLSASNYYTSFFSPIQTRYSKNPAGNIQLLISALVNQNPRWDTIDLHPMPLEGDQFEVIHQEFQRAGLAVQTYFCFGNWYLMVDGRSFQEYFESLPSRLRNTIKKKSRLLTQTQQLKIKLVQDGADLCEAITDYERVYNSSWKRPESHPRFIGGLMHTCAKNGWLRLGIAYIDDQPAAAQLWIVHKKIASIYKLAYDEQFSSLSIGTLLTAHMMQYVIDVDSVEEVDYLTGDDAYKQDWMSHRRERWGVMAFNLHTLSGTLSSWWHIGRSRIKKKLSKLRRTFAGN